MKYIIILLLLRVASFVYFATRKPKLIDKAIATYSGRVADYKGGKTLVVAFTASWASFWKITESELNRLDNSQYDICIVDQAIDKEEFATYDVKFLPTVFVVEKGKITKRIQNMNKAEQITE